MRRPECLECGDGWVDVKDPNEAHKKMALELDDPANKKMYDITAYLWSIK